MAVQTLGEEGNQATDHKHVMIVIMRSETLLT